MPKIFISYRREDAEHVTGRIYDRLEPHFGRDNVFFDVDAIPFGVDFREYLDQAVGQCDVLLAVIGEQWLDVRFTEGPKQGKRRLDDQIDFVRIEIQSALARKIPVIPVLVGRAMLPGEQDLPEVLRGLAFRNAAAVRSGPDFHGHVDRLIRGVEYVVRQVQNGAAKQEPRPVQEPTKQRPVAASPALAREAANSIGMKFVLIPAGTFVMGSPETEAARLDREGPQHEVAITRPFYLGVHPVTQAQWRAVMGNNPSWFCATGKGKDDVKGMNTNDFPVEQVSWEDATAFLNKLSALEKEQKAGRNYRLPSEAEWEYSCRGGLPSTQAFHFGNALSSTQANFNGNHPYGEAEEGPYLGRTCEVGAYEPKRFGLSDMHGNVWEWCADWFGEGYYASSPKADPPGPSEGSDRVFRGGGWSSRGRHCRSAGRGRDAPAVRNGRLGFRVALFPSGK